MDKPSLLIVDDEPIIREILKRDFAEYDINLVFAEDGLKGLETLRSQSIDAVITDIKMPKMDGLEFLKQAREERFLTPFIILTGYSEKDFIIRALRLRVVDFLEKPPKMDVLLKKTVHALSLGVLFRSIEPELNHLCEKENIPASELEQFKDTHRLHLMIAKEFELVTTGDCIVQKKPPLGERRKDPR